MERKGVKNEDTKDFPPVTLTLSKLQNITTRLMGLTAIRAHVNVDTFRLIFSN
jgi:hypothetical protein